MTGPLLAFQVRCPNGHIVTRKSTAGQIRAWRHALRLLSLRLLLEVEVVRLKAGY